MDGKEQNEKKMCFYKVCVSWRGGYSSGYDGGKNLFLKAESEAEALKEAKVWFEAAKESDWHDFNAEILDSTSASAIEMQIAIDPPGHYEERWTLVKVAEGKCYFAKLLFDTLEEAEAKSWELNSHCPEGIWYVPKPVSIEIKLLEGVEDGD